MKSFCISSAVGQPVKSPCPAWGEDELIADQFEVSECTLPGPSVGDITEDGVVASCHPPLAWDAKGKGWDYNHIFCNVKYNIALQKWKWRLIHSGCASWYLNVSHTIMLCD